EAVDTVGEHDGRDRERGDDEVAQRQQPHRQTHGEHGADHRDGIGADPGAHQCPGDRPEDGVGEATSGRAQHGASSSHAAATASRGSPRTCGSALVWATIARKFASPAQRGTTCWCTWAAIPAPPTSPWFIPRLKPAGALTRRSTRIAVALRSVTSWRS